MQTTRAQSFPAVAIDAVEKKWSLVRTAGIRRLCDPISKGRHLTENYNLESGTIICKINCSL